MALQQSSRLNQATPLTDNNVGVVASAIAANLFVTEMGDGIHHRTQLQFQNLPVTVANTTGASFGSALLYTFPQGLIFVKAFMAKFSSIAFNTTIGGGSAIGTGGSGDYSVGTTATADATLSSTDVNLLPSTAMLDPFVGGLGSSNVGSYLAAGALFDGTATAIPAYLNVIIDDADVADASTSTVYFTGSAQITWEWNGDY